MEMEQNVNPFQPTKEWPLQEGYKRRLHEQIQRWGEAVAPGVETQGEDQEERIAFFQFLMESVIRNDSHTAYLIEKLIAQMHESTRSWYTGVAGTATGKYARDMSQRDFESLFAIYKTGVLSRD